MRIQSPFKDYYDFVQKFGTEHKLVYERKTTKIDDENIKRSRPLYFLMEYAMDYNNPGSSIGLGYTKYSSLTDLIALGVETYTIGFCGHFYRIVKYQSTCCYEINDWKNLFISLTSEDRWNEYSSGYKKSLGAFFRKPFHYAEIKHYSWVFNHAPVFSHNHSDVAQKDRITLNPRLSDFKFHRMFPPRAAYQELAMWFANKATPPPIPQIDDKTMAQAKGYDKYSFRKPPST